MKVHFHTPFGSLVWPNNCHFYSFENYLVLFYMWDSTKEYLSNYYCIYECTYRFKKYFVPSTYLSIYLSNPSFYLYLCSYFFIYQCLITLPWSPGPWSCWRVSPWLATPTLTSSGPPTLTGKTPDRQLAISRPEFIMIQKFCPESAIWRNYLKAQSWESETVLTYLHTDGKNVE